MATKKFNVNSSTYTAVPVPAVCRELDAYENDQAGTTDFYVSASGADADAVTKPAGSKATFRRSTMFQPTDIPAYIKTVSGSVTFAVETRE